MIAEGTEAGAPTLLFVEDDADWAFLFCREFQKLAPDWEVLYDHNGAAAMRRLNNDQGVMPRVLVTDLNMPGGNGFELIEWIKSQPQFRFLPIFVVTSSNDPDHRQRCADMGVSEYLDKTASLSAFRNKMPWLVKRCEESLVYSEYRKQPSCV